MHQQNKKISMYIICSNDSIEHAVYFVHCRSICCSKYYDDILKNKWTKNLINVVVKLYINYNSKQIYRR